MGGQVDLSQVKREIPAASMLKYVWRLKRFVHWQVLKNTPRAQEIARARIFVYEELPSTQTLISADKVNFFKSCDIVVAIHQSAGYGRKTRRWQSTPGASLTMSLCLTGLTERHVPIFYTQLIGLGLIESLRYLSTCSATEIATALAAIKKLPGLLAINKLGELGEGSLAGVPLATQSSSLPSPLGCTLKWPNDVLVNNKKIAGILIHRSHLAGEASSSGNNNSTDTSTATIITDVENNDKKEDSRRLNPATTTSKLVIGVGLNVLEAAEELCRYDRLNDLANANEQSNDHKGTTSFSYETGRYVSVWCHLRVLLEKFFLLETLHLRREWGLIVDQWRKYSDLLGREFVLGERATGNCDLWGRWRVLAITGRGSVLLEQVEAEVNETSHIALSTPEANFKKNSNKDKGAPKRMEWKLADLEWND
ncbi:hypothetical protein COTS27_00119 [Spirochaetota bacterium]|nr:hypothetical protein COTS27_00119 [Spirochaetota bacterium]